jgi:KipI family sensor histidine kinase inhibitor
MALVADPYDATPVLLPLGDGALLVRFGDSLSEAANRSAVALTRRLEAEPIRGVLEVVPNLVSVLVRYDPLQAQPQAIAGELRLRLYRLDRAAAAPRHWTIPVRFDGADLDEVATLVGLSRAQFIELHNASPLRVLATGFAPGFVYCGMHPAELVVPRRTAVRPSVPAGSLLFAAGQTAITAIEMPTGWHVIGSTSFRNFDPQTDPPTLLTAGDTIKAEPQ